MAETVRVLRSPPRPRDKIEDLSGVMRVAVRVCSKRDGCGVDSYLFVGKGLKAVKLKPEVLKRLASDSGGRGRGDLTRLVEELENELNFEAEQFSSRVDSPVLPGSTIKGNVRARIELSFVEKNGSVRTCLIVASDLPIRPPNVGQEGWRHFRIWSRSLSFKRGYACRYSEEHPAVCLTCDLFGTTGLAGLVEFNDLKMEGGQLVEIEPFENEKLVAAAPGTVFRGSIFFKNLKPEELGLILFGMGLRKSHVGRPVLLGKHKYAKQSKVVMGIVRYELEALSLARFSKRLELAGEVLEPGSTRQGPGLDKLVAVLIDKAKTAFKDELIDVDEVGELDKLNA